MIPEKDKEFIKLIVRSPDRGDGWRNVSDVVWPLVEAFSVSALIEVDKENKRIRLTQEGVTFVTYAL